MKAQSGSTGKGMSRRDYLTQTKIRVGKKTNSGRNGGTGVKRQGSSSASGVYKQKRGK
jgi:hypothetical protein